MGKYISNNKKKIRGGISRMKMICKKCKKYIPNDSTLCCYCGNNITDMDKLLHNQNEKRKILNMQRNISKSNKTFEVINIQKSNKSRDNKKRKTNKFILIPIAMSIIFGIIIISTMLNTK